VQEVTNNWYPGEIITDERYGGSIAADDLAATARQALYEYYPIPDNKPLYGKVSYGKHLDVILLDMRSYRYALALV
jgi:alkaline phosphatase D